jgi:hypothetical protein
MSNGSFFDASDSANRGIERHGTINTKANRAAELGGGDGATQSLWMNVAPSTEAVELAAVAKGDDEKGSADLAPKMFVPFTNANGELVELYARSLRAIIYSPVARRREKHSGM